jgi:arginase family enzyme
MPFDNKAAVAQMEVAYSTLLARPVPENTCAHEAPSSMSRSCSTRSLALDGKPHPRILTLGGDHAIVSGFTSFHSLPFLFILTAGKGVADLEIPSQSLWSNHSHPF